MLISQYIVLYGLQENSSRSAEAFMWLALGVAVVNRQLDVRQGKKAILEPCQCIRCMDLFFTILFKVSFQR